MTHVLPEGHPILWDELVPYERQQGGYWLYPRDCGVHGNGRVWVSVQRPRGEDAQRAAATVDDGLDRLFRKLGPPVDRTSEK